MGLALGKRTVIKYEDPLLELLIRRGLEHERRFVDSLSANAATVVDIPAGVREHDRVATTLRAMRDGVDVIVQGGLRHGEWNGRPDVMLRVPTKSGLGDWSYEAVAPYNAHVNRLLERLANVDASVRVGTVDKFQGQEAPVVIYSMATSRPEDAPRGMEFVYSLNRLNVATSRARCLAVLVASPRLFEADCRTPRQMHLANALCRYREMATPIVLR
jgi:hypothetical protein